MALSTAQRSARWRKKNPSKSRSVNREGQQRFRDAAKEAAHEVITWPEPPTDPGAALCEWARDKLIVPPGHPKAGERFELPEYLAAFFADALADETHEAALIIARKNAKSAGVAALLLAFLVGPLRREGWRCGVASLSREKAGELRSQVEAIATASGLEGVQFWKRGAPSITTEGGGSIDILSADKNAGAASSYDLACVDELGLMAEKHRPLVNSMRSSISAKRGKFLALSVWGDGPFCGEIVKRRDDPGVAVHLFQPAPDCALDSEAAHHAANPGLICGIKSIEYMKAEARRVLATPSDQSSFRALDLNLPGSPSKELVCSPSDWQACVVPASELPARSGPGYIGFDAGGSSSMTAAAAYWPETKRLEIYAAFPATPNLIDRGVADGVGRIYQEAFERSELQVYDGRVTPIGAFLLSLAAALEGAEIAGAASDQYRRAEVQGALEAEALEWPWSWRRMGAGPQGSGDVRAFQRIILRGEFRTVPSLLMPLALKSTFLRRDGNGNPALERGNTGRIDVLSATVLAAGLGAASSGDDSFAVTRIAV